MIFKYRRSALRWRVGLAMILAMPSGMAQQTEPVQLPGIVMRWKSRMPDDMATTTVEAIERCMSGRVGLLARRTQMDAEGQPLREEHAALDLQRAAIDKQFEQVRQEQADLANEGHDLEAQKLALHKARATASQDPQQTRMRIDQFNKRIKLHNDSVKQINQHGQDANLARDAFNQSVAGFIKRANAFNEDARELDQRIAAFGTELRGLQAGCEGERRLIK